MDNKPYKPKFRNVSLYASTPPPTTEQSVATVAAIHQQSTPISSINEQGPVTAPAYAIPPKMKVILIFKFIHTTLLIPFLIYF